MSKFTIKVLDWDDFDRLADKNPKYSEIHDSWAFSDPETGTAYVRHHPNVMFTGLTMVHELEHLVNPSELHRDKHGMMHKKFFKQAVLPALGAIAGSLILPGVGTALGASSGGLLAGTLSAVGAGLGGGLGARAGGADSGSALRTGLISGALQGGSLLARGLTAPRGLTGAAQAGRTSIQGPATGSMLTQSAQFGGATRPSILGSAVGGAAGGAKRLTGTVGGQSGQQLFGGPHGIAGDLAKGIMDLTNKGISSLTNFGKSVLGLNAQGTGYQQGAQANPQLGKFGFGGFGNLAPILAGGGLLAKAASFETPEPPSYEDFMSPTQSALTQRLLGGRALTPAGQAATDELHKIITSPFGEYFPAYNDPYVAESKRQNEINYHGDPTTGRLGLRDQIINRYAAMGHFEGRSGLLDSLLERSDQEFLRGQNQLDQESQFRAQEYEKTSRFQAIQTALELDEAQMRDLLNLANIDISIAALKYGLEVEDVRAMRDLFGQAGGMALAAGALA